MQAKDPRPGAPRALAVVWSTAITDRLPFPGVLYPAWFGARCPGVVRPRRPVARELQLPVPHPRPLVGRGARRFAGPRYLLAAQGKVVGQAGLEPACTNYGNCNALLIRQFRYWPTVKEDHASGSLFVLLLVWRRHESGHWPETCRRKWYPRTDVRRRLDFRRVPCYLPTLRGQLRAVKRNHCIMPEKSPFLRRNARFAGCCSHRRARH